VPRNPDEIGALWIGKGKVAFTGTIAGEKVIVVANDYKQPGEKTPDFRVLKSRPKTEAPPSRQVIDEDIPF
jgi:acetyl-CoA carboxylase carboxyltransferase component